MPNITVDLSETITSHQGPIKHVTLREPGFAEIMRFGEPYARGYASDGSIVYSAENIDAIRGYIEALIQAPADALLLNQLKTRDTLRLKDAVINFFTSARSKPSADASTSSSSTSTSSTQQAPQSSPSPTSPTGSNAVA